MTAAQSRIFVDIIILTGVREAESKSTVAGVAVLLRFSFHVPLDGRLNEVTGALFFYQFHGKVQFNCGCGRVFTSQR